MKRYIEAIEVATVNVRYIYRIPIADDVDVSTEDAIEDAYEDAFEADTEPAEIEYGKVMDSYYLSIEVKEGE